MGNSGGIPDISVRLSAQGVQDVVNAFQRVRQEAKQTGEESAAGIELLNGALETLTELLPALSIAVVVDKLVEMGTAAYESAEGIGKLSEKTGISASALSVFNLAAQETGVETEALSNGIIKLTKASQDAADGVVKPKKAFADLGITLDDLKTNNPSQLFQEVAEKLQGIEDPGKRAQVVIALFGKAGAELIPVLNKIGEEGFDALQAKAERLGVYLSADFVASAQKTKSDLADLEAAGQGAALEFDSGLLPAVDGVAKALVALAGGGEGFHTFGVGVGQDVLTLSGWFAYLVKFLRLAAAEYQSLESHVNASADKMNATIGFTAAQRAKAAQSYTGDVQESKDAVAARDAANADYDNTIAALVAAQTSLYLPNHQMRPPASTGGGTATGTGQSQADKEKQQKAYSDYQQSLADNELALLQTTNQLEEAENKRHFDQGILTVDEYYDKEEARIVTSTDAEIAALVKKKAAIDLLPSSTPEQADTKAKDQAKVDTQIAQLRLQGNAQIEQAEADRAAKNDAYAIKQLQDTEKLQQASGDKYGAEETALELEIRQYAELLNSQGKSLEQINEMTNAYRQRAQAVIDFGRNQEQASLTASNLNLGIGTIQNQAANGSITNISAQAQINQLQQDSLSTLGAIGLQMFKNAVLSQDPKNIEAANAFIAANQKLAASLTNVTTAQTYLVNQLSGQGYTDLVDFFTAGIDGSKSFGQALTDLGNQFEQIVAGMIAKLLVYEALQEILGWIAPNSAAKINLTNNGPFAANPLTGHGDGGWTGDAPTNKVTGYVHGQEYVIRAGPAAANMALLDAINNGVDLGAIRTPSSVSAGIVDSYAQELSGSPTTTAHAEAPVIQIINTTGQPTSQNRRRVRAVRASLKLSSARSPKTLLAGGGQIAKTLQTNYGVVRQGTRRG